MPRTKTQARKAIAPKVTKRPAGATGKPALIYCRVSDTKQRTQGHGLDSQEFRCREHAQAHGYTVEAVFPDDVTGGGDFMKRPGMVALLDHLARNRHTEYAVIFDDLKRFSRDTMFHWKLRHTLESFGATVECLNYKFEHTPEGEFIETVLVAHGELERKQNGRQTFQKMRARVLTGYYLFAPVPGYRFEMVEGHGKMLVPDEPNASIVRDALNGFSTGRFQTATEIKRYMERFPSTPRNTHGEVRLQLVIDMIQRPLYAGYISVPKWGLHLHPGLHEPLISFATWKKNQARLNGNAHAPARKDLNESFPLRNFITCGACGHPMTAAFSKGRSAQYGYYFCQSRTCSERKKSIRKEVIEAEFETLLSQLTPSQQLFKVARAMLKDLWDVRLKNANEQVRVAKVEIAKLDRKLELLMERLLNADNELIITNYENQIKKIEEEKLLLAEKAQKQAQPKQSFEETYRTACTFLESPMKLWTSGKIELKRLVLRLAFGGGLPYFRNQGYRTAEIAAPFRLLGGLTPPEYKLVGPLGVEPSTNGL